MFFHLALYLSSYTQYRKSPPLLFLVAEKTNITIQSAFVKGFNARSQAKSETRLRWHLRICYKPKMVQKHQAEIRDKQTLQFKLSAVLYSRGWLSVLTKLASPGKPRKG